MSFLPRLLLVSLLGVPLAACVGASSTTGRALPPDDAPRRVGAADVQAVTEDVVLVGPAIAGTLASPRRAVLRAELAAPVERVAVRVGDHVRAGQLLATLRRPAARLEARAALANVRSAELRQRQAEAERRRTEELLRVGGASRAELDAALLAEAAATADRELAEARAQAAGTDAQRTTLRAPFAGVVAARRADPGDVLQEGDPVLELVDPSRLELVASLPAELAGAVRAGQPVRLRVLGHADEVEARVGRVAPVLDDATRQLLFRADVPNPGGRIAVGAFVEGRLVERALREPTVSRAALDSTPRGLEVAHLRGGRVRRVAVRPLLAAAAGGRVAVDGALAVGDTVLVGAPRTLGAGTRIVVED
ncbi:MAG: efflux RND transporter periplasmic adaptor subunit [Gemmatimonadales bacterium]|nr:efflux RND transporter periplasmic adaptor subunit [Gemmatimonadales bacterium]